MLALTAIESEYIREHVFRHTGNRLGPEKAYLIEARLAPILVDEKLDNFTILVSRLMADPNGAFAHRVQEAMLTQETSFFRDVSPFQCLKDTILPSLFQRRIATREIRIWCAACSTGQEPCSVAMLLRESFPLQVSTWNIRILATDISPLALKRAEEGIYSQLEMNRGLPIQHRLKYFKQNGRSWQLAPECRNMIEYRVMNLTEPWPPMGPMDVILIRNVMIYFTLEARKAILKNIRKILRPDGFLFLGGAETTLNIDEAFEPDTLTTGRTYRLKVQAGAACR
jgi:chemotaxis protein methyltransferase CheR